MAFIRAGGGSSGGTLTDICTIESIGNLSSNTTYTFPVAVRQGILLFLQAADSATSSTESFTFSATCEYSSVYSFYGNRGTHRYNVRLIYILNATTSDTFTFTSSKSAAGYLLYE